MPSPGYMLALTLIGAFCVNPLERVDPRFTCLFS